MYSVELKIKRKQLASEARDIRTEERRAKAAYGGASPQYVSLYMHRTKSLRYHARYSQLAHAFLTGRPYKSVEKSSQKSVYGPELAKVILKFGLEQYGRTSPDKEHRGKDVLVWSLFGSLSRSSNPPSKCLSAVVRWVEGLPIIDEKLEELPEEIEAVRRTA